MDLMRLEVIGDDLPPRLKLKSVMDRMNYARVRIGDGDFLLPDSSDAVLVDSNGEESRNRMRFTQCHQYTGLSRLTFEDLEPAGGNIAPAAKAELELPPNLDFAFSLAEEIRIDQAAIGDPVHAQLYADLKYKGHILASKGAVVTGRISRIERHPSFTILGFIFSDLESNAVHARLDLRFDRVAGVDAMPNGSWGLNAPAMEHEGIVPLRAGRALLMRGTLMFWRT
jgi:hypothetical protein